MTSATSNAAQQVPQKQRNLPKQPNPKRPNIDDRSSTCQQDISLHLILRVSAAAAAAARVDFARPAREKLMAIAIVRTR
jgi:hypothetical protein